MRMRFLVNATLQKTTPDGEKEDFFVEFNRCIPILSFQETDDPDFINIILEDGVLENVNRSTCGPLGF